MKRYLILSLIICAASTLLLNCDCNKRLCTNAYPVARFVNFDSASLHVVILKSYANDGKFDQLQRTQVYSISVENGVDTIYLNNNTITLDFFTDFTLELPSANKTWYIRNITSHYDKMAGATACTGGMTYYLNDTVYTIAPNGILANQPGYIDIIH